MLFRSCVERERAVVRYVGSECSVRGAVSDLQRRTGVDRVGAGVAERTREDDRAGLNREGTGASHRAGVGLCAAVVIKGQRAVIRDVGPRAIGRAVTDLEGRAGDDGVRTAVAERAGENHGVRGNLGRTRASDASTKRVGVASVELQRSVVSDAADDG